MNDLPSPAVQGKYQVRFDTGSGAISRICVGADVIVWVDVLADVAGSSAASSVHPALAPAVPGVSAIPDAAASDSTASDSAASDRAGSAPAVVAGDFRSRAAIAAWALAQQGDKGDRFTVAVVAAGRAGDDRFVLENLLASGAVIDALADVGIDYCSPEAAGASAAFTGLRHALGPIVSASVSGQLEAAAGRSGAARVATEVDATSEVRLLRPAGATSTALV